MKRKPPKWAEDVVDVALYFVDLVPAVIVVAQLAASGVKTIVVACTAVLFVHIYMTGRRHMRWELKEWCATHHKMMDQSIQLTNEAQAAWEAELDKSEQLRLERDDARAAATELARKLDRESDESERLRLERDDARADACELADKLEELGVPIEEKPNLVLLENYREPQEEKSK